MIEHFYKVADLVFMVRADERLDLAALLRNCEPFRVAGGEPVAVFDLYTSPVSYPEKTFLESDDSDMGHSELFLVNGGSHYLLELSEEGKKLGIMLCNRAFTNMEVRFNPASPYAGLVVSSMLRIAFAQRVLAFGGISMHSSTILCDGRGYMFMGKSGTGKSTHTRLWIENIPGAELLNDDNPYVRVVDGRATVYGSPWSGKTPCYRNLSAPLGGIVRLYQAPYNKIRRTEDVDALNQVLPGCSVLRRDSALHEMLVDNVLAMIEATTVAALECLPDADAARTSHEFLTK